MIGYIRRKIHIKSSYMKFLKKSSRKDEESQAWLHGSC